MCLQGTSTGAMLCLAQLVSLEQLVQRHTCFHDECSSLCCDNFAKGIEDMQTKVSKQQWHVCYACNQQDGCPHYAILQPYTAATHLRNNEEHPPRLSYDNRSAIHAQCAEVRLPKVPTPVQEETTYTAAKPMNCSTVKTAMTLKGTVSTNGTWPSLSNLHQHDRVAMHAVADCI